MNRCFSAFGLLISVLCALTLGVPKPGAAQSLVAGDLKMAKALYATADYEEALAQLSSLDTGEDIGQVEQYRALCLLALGRADEARRALELIVTQKPLYKMNEADVSPRLIGMFRDVRKRLLPTSAKELYAKAKANFDQKKYGEASPQLKDLLAILADEDLAGDAASLSDLKQLGEGFLALATAELGSASKLTPAAPAPAARPPALATAAPPIYTTEDSDVTPPVEIERRMPPWLPSNLAMRRTEYRGILEVIIDEKGDVESAFIRRPVNEFYDGPLLQAAKQWKYRPAKKNGQPVKYRKLVEVVLSAQN